MAASSESQPTAIASPIIIDGKATAKDIRGELKERVTAMKAASGKVRISFIFRTVITMLAHGQFTGARSGCRTGGKST